MDVLRAHGEGAAGQVVNSAILSFGPAKKYLVAVGKGGRQLINVENEDGLIFLKGADVCTDLICSIIRMISHGVDLRNFGNSTVQMPCPGAVADIVVGTIAGVKGIPLDCYILEPCIVFPFDVIKRGGDCILIGLITIGTAGIVIRGCGRKVQLNGAHSKVSMGVDRSTAIRDISGVHIHIDSLLIFGGLRLDDAVVGKAFGGEGSHIAVSRDGIYQLGLGVFVLHVVDFHFLHIDQDRGLDLYGNRFVRLPHGALSVVDGNVIGGQHS